MIARAHLVGLLALSCIAGCKESGKSGNKQAAPAAPGAIPVASDLSLLPSDAELVVSVDWKQLQTTPLWRQHALPAIMSQREVVAVVAAIKERCGIDVATDVTHVTVGLKGIEQEVPEGAMVLRGLDKTKAFACPEKFKAEAAREELTFQRDHDVLLATDADGYGLGLVFLGDRALVTVGHRITFDRVRQSASGTGSLATSRAFVDMLAKVNVNATVWGFVRGTAMQSEIEDLIDAKPLAVYGSVALGDAASAVIRARFPSDELAKQTADSVRARAGAIPFVDHISLTASGSDVVLDVHASADKLDAFAELLKSSIE
jgi:hypothetical protein